jgi:hypothetical protein
VAFVADPAVAKERVYGTKVGTRRFSEHQFIGVNRDKLAELDAILCGGYSKDAGPQALAQLARVAIEQGQHLLLYLEQWRGSTSMPTRPSNYHFYAIYIACRPSICHFYANYGL